MHARALSRLALIVPLGLVATSALASGSLADLGIEELMQQPVTSVSRKEQRLGDTAAAIHVITQDDIERSGATTLPDVLALAPGVEVAQINSHTYSVTIRGFGGQWSDKLLVLVDGRPVYTETYGGVYWDMQGLMLEDIERIEVIRGPGASVWGTNAVNGVINIISKSARDTRGGLVSALAGKEEKGAVAGRYGFEAGKHGHLRLYAKGQKQDDGLLPDGSDAHDDYRSTRAGFRGDWDLPSGDRLTVLGNAQHSRFDITSFDPSSTFLPLGALAGSTGEGRGHDLLTRWTRTLSLSSEATLQLYYDHAERREFVDLVEDHLDLDVQHRFSPAEDHELTWGLGARYRSDDIANAEHVSISPNASSDMLYSLFLQDEIRLAHDAYRLTLGSKFEHNAYSGWEILPSARLLWNLDPRHKLWAAVSRAARTSMRVDRDVDIRVSGTTPQLIPNNDPRIPSPYIAILPDYHIMPNKDFGSETVTSYELGYRTWPRDDLSLDLSLFLNDYQDVRATTFDAGDFTPIGVYAGYPLLLVPLNGQFLNGVHGQTYGVELSALWHVARDWRLQGVFSHLEFALTDDTGDDNDRNVEGSAPRDQLALRSRLDIDHAWSWDLQVKYVGPLTSPFPNELLPGGRIDSYVDLDTRLAWRVRKNLQLTLVGKNLLDGSRMEFSSEAGSALTMQQRSYHLKALVGF